VKRLVSRLTYANVMATIAVFIALGGASYAATQLPKNSVGTRQLKNGAVTSAKIKNGAVTGSKIALSSLGTVPSATTATSATRATSAANADTAGNAQALDGKSAEQIAAQSKLSCPAGTQLFGGLCFETSPRPSALLSTAMLECVEAGRWLPTITQLLAYEEKNLVSEVPSEWTESIFYGPTRVEGYVATGSSEGSNFSFRPISESNPFRCVVAPTN
jgi:hypothetical protein